MTERHIFIDVGDGGIRFALGVLTHCVFCIIMQAFLLEARKVSVAKLDE